MPGQRNLVIAAGSDAGSLPDDETNVTVQWIAPEKLVSGVPAGRVATFDSVDGLEGALREASKRIDRAAESAFYRVGVCAAPNRDVPARLSINSDAEIEINLTMGLEGERGGSCDPGLVATTTRPAVTTVELILTPEELSVYQDRLDEVMGLIPRYGLPSPEGKIRFIVEGAGTAKDDFPLHIRLDPLQEPIRATGHLRGQNALFCDRKSYTINLSGSDARPIREGVGSDEFYLVSMCQDAGFFVGYVGDTVYSQFGLFPPRFQYVELKLNGQTRGVYLMLEKREEELIRDSGRLRGVIRRRYESLVPPEVEYSDGPQERLLAAYDALLAESVGDEELPEYLRERMDLDQYLRWAALNAVLQNADTADESLFISTESVDGEGRPADYFRLMSWDPEDIQGQCDAPTSDLVSDPNGLLFCQEAALDRCIFTHPVIYDDYLTVLESTLQELTVERYRAVLEEARAGLFPLLERPGVVSAMQMLGAYTADSMKNQISLLMDLHLGNYEYRRQELLSKIDLMR
jgi:hypothetical protein